MHAPQPPAPPVTRRGFVAGLAATTTAVAAAPAFARARWLLAAETVIGEGDHRYRVLREGTGWELVESLGYRAHARLFADGHQRVLIHSALRDGSHAYTVAKRSEFVKFFPVRTILAALNDRERGWGGGSTVGGAPRNADGSRSRLTPDEVFDIVELVVRASTAACRID